MSKIWDRTLTTLLTLAALAVAAALVRREFFATQAAAPPRAEYVREWRDILPATRLVTGDPQAPVTIVEFSDFGCPACRLFHCALQVVRTKYPDKVSYSFAHFPLPAHRSALRAARASECASTFGRFALAIDVLFANQDSLGNADWPWFTAEVPVLSKAAFERCMTEKATPSKVLAGLSAGSRLKIRGTPTIFLNGWRYPGMPADTEFVRAVEDLLAGRKPYPSFPVKAMTAPRELTARD